MNELKQQLKLASLRRRFFLLTTSTSKYLQLLPPTRKKVTLDFFSIEKNQILGKAQDFLNLIGKFGLNNFPGF